jgi:dihydroxyacetone kinase
MLPKSQAVVVRASEMPENKVVVINGGGSGHYPAFYGYIGDGLMDATVVGNVLTSPSSEDALSVASSVNQGTGILIIGGNYASDKKNFDIARETMINSQ